MKRNTKIILIITALVFAVILIGGYRAYIDHTLYLTGLDYVLTTIAGAIWQIMTNVVVLTALSIILVLQLGGKQLGELIGRLKKLTALGASAEFDTNLMPALPPKDSISYPEEVAETKNNGHLGREALTHIVNNIRPHILEYLLEVDGREMSLKNHVSALSKTTLGKNMPDEITAEYTLWGVVNSMANFEYVLLEFNMKTEKHLLTYSLYPEVKEIIKEKLQIET